MIDLDQIEDRAEREKNSSNGAMTLAPTDVLELIASVRDMATYKRLVPDITIETQNPISQVYFRAGLLACREYMARFVEQGGDAITARSIRANWWPKLGDDPGAPRKFDFAEIAAEQPDGTYAAKTISPSVEALPIALGFIDWE